MISVLEPDMSSKELLVDWQMPEEEPLREERLSEYSLDFHTHTDKSDGVFTPRDSLSLFDRRGGFLLSITDHDTIDAYKELALQAPTDPFVRNAMAYLIPAVELSLDWKGEERHILVYGFNPYEESVAMNDLRKIMADNTERKAEARLRDLEALNKMLEEQGYRRVPPQDVLRKAQGEYIGTRHIALAIAEMVGCSLEDVFDEFVDELPGRADWKRYGLEEVIMDVGISSDAVFVAAHPGRYRPNKATDNDLFNMVDGIEVFYPSHTADQQRYLMSKAEEHGRLVTGGSDFHGTNGKVSHRVPILHRPDNPGYLTAETPEIQPFLKAMEGRRAYNFFRERQRMQAVA